MSEKAKTSWNGYSLRQKLDVPEGLWQRCPGCEELIFSRRIEENLGVCPECDHHYRIGARRRIEQLCDEGSFEEMLEDCAPADPLEFVDSKPYCDRLKSMQKKTGLADAAVTGKGFIKGRPVIVAALDPDFMMGTMGSVVGEKVTAAMEAATKKQ
jgi:acetyl-CoA carboxylase carboxyl transferase subunit beta